MSKQIGAMRVKALQAYTRDVGRNIARLDPKTMEVLGIALGGVLEILGEQKTVSKCMSLYKSDLDKGFMRVDGLIRQNAGLQIGDDAEIMRIEPVFAEKLILAPLRASSSCSEEYIIEALNGMPVSLGDKVLVPYGLEWEPFVLLEAVPSGDAYLIGNNTKAELMQAIV